MGKPIVSVVQALGEVHVRDQAFGAETRGPIICFLDVKADSDLPFYQDLGVARGTFLAELQTVESGLLFNHGVNERP